MSGAGASWLGDRPVMPTNKCPNSPTRAGTESIVNQSIDGNLTGYIMDVLG